MLSKKSCDHYFIFDKFNSKVNEFNSKDETLVFKSNKKNQKIILSLGELNLFKKKKKKFSLHINRFLKGSKKFVKKYSKNCKYDLKKYDKIINGKKECFYITSCDIEKIANIINKRTGTYRSGRRAAPYKRTTRISTISSPTPKMIKTYSPSPPDIFENISINSIRKEAEKIRQYRTRRKMLQ